MIMDAFADELEKCARIFGASPDTSLISSGAIPEDVRRQAHDEYLGAKSEEDPTSAPAATLGGGAIGALLGGGLGLQHGRPATIRGAAVGGGLGALAGLLLRAADKGEIGRARDAIGDGESDRAMANLIVSAENRRRYEDDLRHRELLSAMAKE